MVSDIGGKIGRAAVRLYQHPVLVIPVLGRPEPEGAVLFEGQGLVRQFAELGIDHVAVIKALFAVPVVKSDAECLEVSLDPLQNIFDTKSRTALDDFIFIEFEHGRVFFLQPGRQVLDVISLVTVLRKIDGLPIELTQAHPY